MPLQRLHGEPPQLRARVELPAFEEYQILAVSRYVIAVVVIVVIVEWYSTNDTILLTSLYNFPQKRQPFKRSRAVFERTITTAEATQTAAIPAPSATTTSV